MAESEAEREPLDLNDDDLVRVHSRFCGIFADDKRLRIMWLLRDGEQRVITIAERLGISQQNASQHLRLMRDRGALISRREGNAVFYRVANPKFPQGALLIREGLIEEMKRMTEIGRILSNSSEED